MRVPRVWDRGVLGSCSSPSCSPHMDVPQYPPAPPGGGGGALLLALNSGQASWV